MSDLTLSSLAIRLRDATTFVEAAHTVLAAAEPLLGATDGVVEAHDDGAAPVLCVATTGIPRAWLDRHVAFGHRIDPVVAAVRETHVPVATADVVGAREAMDLAAATSAPPSLYTHGVVAPLLGARGVIGLVRWAWPRSAPRAAIPRAGAIAGHLSVRLAQLGFASPALPGGLDRVSVRQLEVARLVARGYTNAEVATALSIGEDAVKKHVKHLLARLDVANRTELAALIARAGATLDHPSDLAEMPGVYVARA